MHMAQRPHGWATGSSSSCPRNCIKILIFIAAQHDPIGVVDGSTGAPNLLVVMNDRAGPLEVDHESKVGLIKAHTQRSCCHQNFEIIRKQPLFQCFTLRRVNVGMISGGIDLL